MAYEEYFPECCYGANEFPQISMMCIANLAALTEQSLTGRLYYGSGMVKQTPV